MNNSLTGIRSYPKVNLALDILNNTASGFHEINTVLHELDAPFDEITIEFLSENRIEVECDNPAVPIGKKNMVYIAAELFKKKFGVREGVKITIKKRIPIEGGLGGGSSNAAAILTALAAHYKISCCTDGRHSLGCALVPLACKIGMDCVFFLAGKTQQATHFGEKLTPLPPLPRGLTFEVFDTGVKIKSSWAYRNLDMSFCGKNQYKTELLINAIREGNTKEILVNMHNDFQGFIFNAYPSLKERQLKLFEPGSRVLLCGSGGCLVRVCASLTKA